jgi:predicted acylesterase/phospholipase RssA
VAESSQADREDHQLRLQRMEAKLVAGLFEHPGVVSRASENQLRYAIALAALDTFQPGAAIKGARTNRSDVRVRSPRLGRWRQRVLEGLPGILLGKQGSRARVEEAARFLESRLLQLEQVREEVVEKYADDFSARELDQELGIKTLVSVAGGGGGSGYVYIGAWEVLQNAGLIPGYVIGASMGSVLGLFRALRKEGDWDEYARIAKIMTREEVFRFVSLRARYGLPGIMRLFLHAAIGPSIRDEAGEELMLSGLAIPFETVVAGVRRDATIETADEYARSHHLPLDKRPSALQLRAQIAAQLVKMVGFINPRVVREIVVGGDELTRDFNAIDAAGFSAAIPGILHYDVTRNDPHMDKILSQLMEREDVTALVDGGVANNVPARTAWRQVQNGKIGTRNVYVLAFDCFHPQVSPGHIWMQPVTRAVAYQVALNERYAQRRIKFKPTLSPINLLPPPDQLDEAVAWGRHQMSEELPLIQKFFERVRWVPPRQP